VIAMSPNSSAMPRQAREQVWEPDLKPVDTRLCPARTSIHECICACLLTCRCNLTDNAVCGYKQPPYALEHANAAWCKLTGFTPLMIKGSYGLEILKVFLLSHSLLIMTSHNRSEQQHSRTPSPPRSPLHKRFSISFWFSYTLTIQLCAVCFVSRVYTHAHHLCNFAHTNKRTNTQQLQGPLTDENVVANAWDTSEKRITVIHYTGAFMHTLKLLQSFFLFSPFPYNNNTYVLWKAHGHNKWKTQCSSIHFDFYLYTSSCLSTYVARALSF
jgi:hypothetical protein